MAFLLLQACMRAFDSSIQSFSRFSIWFGIRFTIWHSILWHIAVAFTPIRHFTTNLFLRLPCNGIPSFFSYTTRASYEDEYESNTSFLTRDACRLAKDQTWKHEYRKLETCISSLQYWTSENRTKRSWRYWAKLFPKDWARNTKIEDILGYLVWIGQRSVFLELWLDESLDHVGRTC